MSPLPLLRCGVRRRAVRLRLALGAFGWVVAVARLRLHTRALVVHVHVLHLLGVPHR